MFIINYDKAVEYNGVPFKSLFNPGITNYIHHVIHNISSFDIRELNKWLMANSGMGVLKNPPL